MTLSRRAAMIVKFATYNIQYGVGQDGRYDLARALAALEDQDVICLQEVTTNWRACNGDDQPGLLSKSLERFAVYAPAYEVDDSRRNPDGTIANARRGFGNMVLSRWPIVYSRPHSLPRPPVEVPSDFHPNADLPRGALEAVIDIEGRALRVFSLHLSHLPGGQRQSQIDALKTLALTLPDEAPLWHDHPRNSIFSERQPVPGVPRSALLLGDYNFEPGSADYRRMSDPARGQTAGLVDGWAVSDERKTDERTCVESGGRHSRLDYMFATPDLSANIRSASVDRTTEASDHFPVYFTVEI